MMSSALLEADWEKGTILVCPRLGSQYYLSKDMIIKLLELYPKSVELKIDELLYTIIPNIETFCKTHSTQCVIHPDGTHLYIIGNSFFCFITKFHTRKSKRNRIPNL